MQETEGNQAASYSPLPLSSPPACRQHGACQL